MGQSILLVEDDAFIGGGLRELLADEGYDAVWARDGNSALASADARPFDLVLLDLGLPDIDGVKVCRELRRRGPVVIVVITARHDESDVILGFDAGADDYVVKPFRTPELLARIRAHFRRPPKTDPERGLRIDEPGQRVWFNGHALSLRPREFALLRLFVERANAVVTRDEIMATVWVDAPSESKTLDMHMTTIRRKLESVGAHGCIKTIRGVGYRLESQ